mgnify:CR=1 FL=1
MTIPVTVFSDYICPFCYIGSLRLISLSDEFDLDITWAGIEIHPETPAEGMPVEDLGYDPAQWQAMMGALERMAGEEGVTLGTRAFTTNSRRALLLAEAAKDAGPAVFACLHERLFRAYLCEGRNIGDAEVLWALASECGLDDRRVEAAWLGTDIPQRLQQYQQAAARVGITGTPTFLINNDRALVGAVETDELRQALDQCLAPR